MSPTPSFIEATKPTVMMENTNKIFSFGPVDYIVFAIMLMVSAGIGVYFGFFSKSKNTTEEYLMGGKKMKTLPIAISLVASQLSGIAIMSVPSENYSFGIGYMFMVSSVVLVIPILNYIIVPVFYNNNITNCYEYLQLRFNKWTRKLITGTFVVSALLMLPVFMFVPSLAFAQVTGINIHLINTIVCSICIFYTMLGGIKAVVWTDVVQAGIMITSVVLVAFLGVNKVGGLGKVLDLAEEGGRLELYFGFDPRVRNSVMGMVSGGVCLWIGHIGLNQSCVQRIVSLPSLENAKRSLIITGIGILIILLFNSFTGVIMFARYAGCDPILAGIVEKADKMVPFFVQDIVGHLRGMPGIFISCVFSAALSTMSATLNSLAGVAYFDYIKPFIRHTDARANAIMKLFVVAMGCYCIAGGFLVEQFSSILQTILTIIALNTGAVVGVFTLGMLVPRVNGKVAIASIGVSMAIMLWIIGNAQMRFKSGAIKYDPLPTRIDECENYNFYGLIQNRTTLSSLENTATSTSEPPPLVTTAFGSNRPFSIYEISFYWYQVIGTLLVWLTAIPLSYVWSKPHGDEKLDPKLFSPIIGRFLDQQPREMESMPLKTPHPSLAGENLKITFSPKE
ncbi:sodium-coupled monocarboxylate transporter 2-like isoform X2 [Musca domestica]|uniref:Sodium-coupled monocarboxylate transporter 2-like isoform X2 n=1 Tax=Musca domestica TaxID=7370 RepID=A0ABM3VR50_MUSDO|nr:sodium-coupled monocarboxylate transporter 2-like isoform X2 [Musca domestica]